MIWMLKLRYSVLAGTGTAYPSGAPESTPTHPVFSGVRVARFIVLLFCRSLWYYFWPLCCLSFFDLRLLTTTLVSSNSSFYQSSEFGSIPHRGVLDIYEGFMIKFISEYGYFESCQFRPRSVFFMSWRLNKSAGDFRCLRFYCDNVSIS